ncbi:ABC transporter substrate-binding protein [Bradyrhizobium canariense]|uniref:ABC transporter substrate-binding protein n=1 Tax=Bradyrhizobium canariense TaxID=255045 RepID=UPI001C933452|nr:ABC transporter substrate-binding protein [Bradyrhizobium canariense]MBW5436105.1 ABC transporter substrate-binding protein [Bradyrhizobium canariense]
MSKLAAVHSALLLKKLNRRLKSHAAIIAIAVSGLSIASAMQTEDASAGKSQSGVIIRYGHFQEPPCLYGGWVQQWYLQRQFSDNLVARAEDGTILPWLATAWTVSDDRKKYTFQIKPDVKFTDGTVLDAQAIVDNINGWLSDNAELQNPTAGPYLRSLFESAAATGPLTLKITLKTPFEPLLNVFAQSSQGILSPTALKRGKAVNCESPIGSGAFIVEKWNRGKNVIFRRNPNYNSAPANAKHQGPAYVEGIEWRFLADPTIRYGSLLTGESDVVYHIPAVNWQDANSRFKVVRHITGGTPLRLALFSARPPFDDMRVRQAFAYASDRSAAVQAAFLGSLPYEGNFSLSQSSPEYIRELSKSYSYDVDKANKLLDKAGWTERDANGIRSKNGNPLIIRITYTNAFSPPDGDQVLQIIQQQAKAAGFDVRLQPTNQADFWAGKNLGPNDYEVLPLYWVAPGAEIYRISYKPDLNGVRNPFNPSRYQDLTLWDIIQKAEQVAEKPERIALYQQAERRIVENAPSLSYTVLDVTLASADNVKDIWLDGGSVGEPVFSDAYFTDKK